MKTIYHYVTLSSIKPPNNQAKQITTHLEWIVNCKAGDRASTLEDFGFVNVTWCWKIPEFDRNGQNRNLSNHHVAIPPWTMKRLQVPKIMKLDGPEEFKHVNFQT